MSINKTLNSLENSWDRDVILLKIKNGLSTDEIVNEFLKKNKAQLKELNSLLRSEDIDLLEQVEQLSICEAKLINRINNVISLKNHNNHHTIIEKENSLFNRLHTTRFPSNKISSFMINWSNKFIVIALLIISAIALTKQAWA